MGDLVGGTLGARPALRAGERDRRSRAYLAADARERCMDRGSRPRGGPVRERKGDAHGGPGVRAGRGSGKPSRLWGCRSRPRVIGRPRRVAARHRGRPFATSTAAQARTAACHVDVVGEGPLDWICRVRQTPRDLVPVVAHATNLSISSWSNPSAASSWSRSHLRRSSRAWRFSSRSRTTSGRTAVGRSAQRLTCRPTVNRARRDESSPFGAVQLRCSRHPIPAVLSGPQAVETPLACGIRL
jgi:hypothetical protein